MTTCAGNDLGKEFDQSDSLPTHVFSLQPYICKNDENSIATNCVLTMRVSNSLGREFAQSDSLLTHTFSMRLLFNWHWWCCRKLENNF